MEITKRELKSFKERKFPKRIIFKPIGIIHSPFKTLKGIPIQSSMSESLGTIEIFPEYSEALKDLDKFSHIICLYYFDMVKLPIPLQSKPFLVDRKLGVFTTRTPFRPNPIGISTLNLIKIENNIISVSDIDILDNTPLLDIKPFVSAFDIRTNSKNGWLEGNVKKMTS
ncbi:MAG: tRNA (N6-threonylcarbamoyladenosine(37)-N6)-methyltransferase TrmO [Candidatus Lokiarchaeota archaeon]|nr:tRNA (N6-threonylcarbamoyladenosine(37)-N6)-methyltransferase TrmO [Candidatus Lokiarchaeota archaeon]